MLMTCPLLGKEKLSDNIEIDGSIEVGLRVENRGLGANDDYDAVISNQFERVMKGELDWLVTLSPYLSASMDIRSDINDGSAKVKKSYISCDITKTSRLRAGNMKKNFGFEEMGSKKENHLAHKSYLHRYISSFSILGHDYQVQYRYRKRFEKSHKLSLFLAGGADADTRIFSTFTSKYQRDNIVWSFSHLYVNHNFIFESEDYHLLIGGVKYTNSGNLLEQEVSFGKDPNGTALYLRMGRNENLYYLGWRSLYGHDFDFSHHLFSSLTPLLETTLLSPNIKDEIVKFQFSPGINITFTSQKTVRWMSNVELLFSLFESSYNDVPLEQIYISSKIQVLW